MATVAQTTITDSVDLHEREINWGAGGMSLAVTCEGDTASWRLLATQAILALARSRQDHDRLQARHERLIDEYRVLRAAQRAA